MELLRSLRSLPPEGALASSGAAQRLLMAARSRAVGNTVVLGSAVIVALLALQRYTHALPGSNAEFALARERCHGIARAGRNDCGTALHACAGRAARDAAGDEWIGLPAGTCMKIDGGSLRATPDRPLPPLAGEGRR